ncbi:MAG: hypothetical protein AAFU55_03775, partial [Pseudomonadota bacterium]
MRSNLRTVACALSLFLAAPVAAQTTASDAAPAPGYRGVGVFEMPAVAVLEQRIGALARAGDIARASDLAADVVARYPTASRFRILQAALAAATGDAEAAIAALLSADEAG